MKAPKVPPLALTGVFAALMWAAARWLPGSFALPHRGWIAMALAFSGIAVALAGIRLFRRAGTTVNPLAPDQASSLVVAGIYRYTRNPMYLGFALFLAAWGIWLANMFALALVAAFVWYMNRHQVAAEEQALRTRFGEEYDQYMQRVRRWI